MAIIADRGFYLTGLTDEKIREIFLALKKIGVRKVAPSHCTGEKAIALFREFWGDSFLEGGVGAIVEFPR